MRKQTKLAAVLSAAALLAIGASMTSFAAAGWTEEDGTWVYLDKDEYKVTNAWKKSGDFWYWLDEDGYMAISRLIENGDENNNIYYVDETGRMVTNKWIELENDDYHDNTDEGESETSWYYFQNSGKAYKTSGTTSFKTINGKKYAFDENGKMLYGWVTEDTSERVKEGDSSYKNGVYYCGDANDGARVTSDWRKLYVGNEGPADSEDDEYWFYFQTNGKKFAAAETDDDPQFKSKKINGKTYGFNEFGMMVSGWTKDNVKATASDLYGYFNDDDNGARQKGWFKAVPSEEMNKSANNDDSGKWYYGQNDGKLVVSELKTINGKKYAFNEKGEMLSGLQALAVVEYNGKNRIAASLAIDEERYITNEGLWDRIFELRNSIPNSIPDYWGETTDPDATAFMNVYYFGSGDDGAMKTGNQNVTVDGETYQFAFGKEGSKKGIGLHGFDKNRAFYIFGKKIKADADYRYQAIAYDGKGEMLVGTDAIGYPLVNTSGILMKGAKYKDKEGRVYTMEKIDIKDANGKVVVKDLYVVADCEWEN